MDFFLIRISDAEKCKQGDKRHEEMRKNAKAEHDEAVFQIFRGVVKLDDGIGDEKRLGGLCDEAGKLFGKGFVYDADFSQKKAYGDQ